MLKFLLLFIPLNIYAADQLITSAASYDESQSVTRQIVADKKNGLIYLKQPGQDDIVAPALFGKVISDDLARWESEYITPSGTFELHKAWSPKMKSFILYFLKGQKTVEAIHPVYIGNKSQRRYERLTNGSNGDERITNGCINTLPEFFDLLMTLPDGTKLQVLKEEESYVMQ